MTASDLKAHLLPGLLSGARNGLALDRVGLGDTLQALSLTGQALRFDRPPMPAQFHVEDEVAETRAILPDAVRRPLLRLLTAKAQGMVPTGFALAVARTLAQRRLRLHPFDLPKLDAFVRAHADYLGAEAAAYADKDAEPAQRRGWFDADALDDSNWAQATPAVRQAYIARRRREDAGAARALVEAVWAAENADIRVRLLGALREGLGGDDVVFLRGLDKDRAPRVRELAQRLLSRLGEPGGEGAALKDVRARIKVGQTGLLKKRPVLSLELPATVKAQMAAPWINETFGDIGLDELAGVLSLSVADMVAAEKDDNLLLAFVIMATHDRRFDIIDRIVGQYLPDAWDAVARSGIDTLEDLDRDDRLRWADILVRPQTWVEAMPLWGLITLHKLIEGPVSESLMDALLRARPWLALLRDPDTLTTDMVDILAVLCPPGRRPALRAQLATLDPAKTTQALNFLAILDALETA